MVVDNRRHFVAASILFIKEMSDDEKTFVIVRGREKYKI